MSRFPTTTSRFLSRSRFRTRTDELDPTAPTAGSSLVVLDPVAPSNTLRAALRHPEPVGGHLYLLVAVPTSEYEARRRARLGASATVPYTIDHLEAEARHIARRAGRELLAPMGVEFEAAVGRLGDTIRTTVRDRAVTRVYVAAPCRTVWQRFLGIHGLTATLAGVLPASVTVVPVDVVDGETDAAGGAAFADVPIDPDAPVGK